MPTAQQKRILQEIMVHLAAFLGYTLPNAALYTNGGFAGAEKIVEMLKGNFGIEIDAVNTDKFFTDEAHITAFVIVVIGMALLGISNQAALAGMIGKKLHEGKITQGNINALPEAEKNKIIEFFTKFANLIGTHFKTIITVTALWQMLEHFISNPYVTLALAAALFLPAGELAQFSLLAGKASNKEILKAGFFSFFESVLAGGIGWLGGWLLSTPHTAVLTALSTWFATLMVDTAVIASTERSISQWVVNWVAEHYCGGKKNNDEELGYSFWNRVQHWRNSCCNDGYEKIMNNPLLS